MHDTYINVVANMIDAATYSRFFISADEQRYVCPKFLLPNTTMKMTDIIVDFLRQHTDVEKPETLYYVLLNVKKTTETELDIVYNVQLPHDTKILSPYYLTSYNISVINPYVRKAIQYI
jgi:hypothetical protein